MNCNFLVPLLFVLSDYIAILCAEELAFNLRNILITNHGVLIIAWYNFYIMIPSIYIILMSVHGLYNKKIQSWRITGSIIKATTYATGFCMLFLYVADLAKQTSRLFVCLLGLFAITFIILFRSFGFSL